MCRETGSWEPFDLGWVELKAMAQQATAGAVDGGATEG